MQNDFMDGPCARCRASRRRAHRHFEADSCFYCIYIVMLTLLLRARQEYVREISGSSDLRPHPRRVGLRDVAVPVPVPLSAIIMTIAVSSSPASPSLIAVIIIVPPPSSSVVVVISLSPPVPLETPPVGPLRGREIPSLHCICGDLHRRGTL
jgi:hypothetical protein